MQGEGRKGGAVAVIGVAARSRGSPGEAITIVAVAVVATAAAAPGWDE